MIDHIIDLLVILVIAYLSKMFWVFSNKKRAPQIKLLFRTISLFIILHLILFPLIYVLLIHKSTSSIKIDENIIKYERETKLEDAIKVKNEIDTRSDSLKERHVVKNILAYNHDYLDTVSWENIDDNHLIFLDTILIKGYTQYKCIPGDQVQKVITFYNRFGKKIIEVNTLSGQEYLSNILFDYLGELDKEKNEIKGKIDIIVANKFWSYRQILPYTLNILFTDNFNPQSRTANIIYFIHNILVVGFLLTFIINLFQYYLLTDK